jgi:hypothetical protein
LESNWVIPTTGRCKTEHNSRSRIGEYLVEDH